MRGYITDPAAPGGLRFADDLAEPQPAPGEALVEVRAYSINRGELRLLGMRTDGWRPGQDLAGVVVARAADGSGPEVGKRVVGLVEGASWSERVAVRTDRLAPIPDAVTFEDAASLPIAGLTALRALRLGGAVLGEHVLITGAAGGVGQFAVQLARRAGARVTALVHRPSQVEATRELGAEAVVTSLDDVALGPFAFVLEGVGGNVLRDALARCAPRATIVLYAGGTGTEIGLASFAAAQLARIVGFFVYAEHGTTMAQDLATLVAFIADGSLRPRLGLVRDWEETRDALDALRTHAVTGKAVLRIPQRG